MPISLLPRLIAETVTDLSPKLLQERGIHLLMLDFDNTLVPYTRDEPTPQVRQWLRAMMDSGISLCVVSNSKRPRVQQFCSQHGLPCVTHARKPFSKGIRRCMESFQLRPQVCALVGDQIYTDTLGANCAGVFSILVKPIHNHNIWLKLRHVAELPFIMLAWKRRLHREKS